MLGEVRFDWYTQLRTSMITKEMAVSAKGGTIFYHETLKNADGSPLRGRVNGACKTWKTRPHDFRLPMKHGMYECFYIGIVTNWQANVEDPKDWFPEPDPGC